MARIELIVSLLWISACECKVPMYGHVQSPLFPEPYLTDLYVRWYLEVPHGRLIQLTINHLDIEPSDNCTKDSLTVLYGDEVLGKFCGQKSTYKHHPGNKAILSPGNHLRLVFKADDSNQGSQMHLGFFAFYQPIGGTNGQDHIGSITDPEVDCGFPEILEADLISLTEEDPLTTYKQNISFKCPSEYYILVGDATFSCDISGNWVSERGQNISQNAPRCVPVCGKNKEILSAGRVFGGKKASLGEIPWQLLIKTPIRGGASLISDRWAITAAVVVAGQETKTLTFYGGMIDGQDQNAVMMETEKIIIHPDYNNPGQKNYDNDIALVKMSTRVPLSANIMPVCLPVKSNGLVMEGKMGSVSGFGAVSETRSQAKFLQYSHLKEYSEFPCFKTDLKVTNNMFCAGDDHKGVDSCKGDSGGPLVIPMLGAGSPETPFQLKGIVSWGPPVCGDKNFKGYYTKVENYLDWIRETMEKN